MVIFLLIYVIGFIATLWFWYYTLNSGTKITLADLMSVIMMCTCSWIAFIIMTMIVYGDKTVFKKK